MSLFYFSEDQEYVDLDKWQAQKLMDEILLQNLKLIIAKRPKPHQLKIWIKCRDDERFNKSFTQRNILSSSSHLSLMNTHPYRSNVEMTSDLINHFTQRGIFSSSSLFPILNTHPPHLHPHPHLIQTQARE